MLFDVIGKQTSTLVVLGCWARWHMYGASVCEKGGDRRRQQGHECQTFSSLITLLLATGLFTPTKIVFQIMQAGSGHGHLAMPPDPATLVDVNI
jgi:hypothetical protein